MLAKVLPRSKLSNSRKYCEIKQLTKQSTTSMTSTKQLIFKKFDLNDNP